MRLRASADLYIYIDAGTRYTHADIRGFVERAAASVRPWCNTRGQALENYFVSNSDTGKPSQSLTLYIVKVSQHGRDSGATLGAQQLFAYRTFVESVARAIVDLKVPGLKSVCGFANYSLLLTEHTAPSSL